MRPLLVIVCGAPGSGKTDLSLKIAGSLMMPLLSKDLIKEALMESEPATDRDGSMAIGKTSFALLFQLAGALLRHGPGLVLEAPFGPLPCRSFRRSARSPIRR
jgi:predicted kinase